MLRRRRPGCAGRRRGGSSSRPWVDRWFPTCSSARAACPRPLAPVVRRVRRSRRVRRRSGLRDRLPPTGPRVHPPIPAPSTGGLRTPCRRRVHGSRCARVCRRTRPDPGGCSSVRAPLRRPAPRSAAPGGQPCWAAASPPGRRYGRRTAARAGQQLVRCGRGVVRRSSCARRRPPRCGSPRRRHSSAGIAVGTGRRARPPSDRGASSRSSAHLLQHPRARSPVTP